MLLHVQEMCVEAVHWVLSGGTGHAGASPGPERLRLLRCKLQSCADAPVCAAAQHMYPAQAAWLFGQCPDAIQKAAPSRKQVARQTLEHQMNA
jgi:hypothetical protein